MRSDKIGDGFADAIFKEYDLAYSGKTIDHRKKQAETGEGCICGRYYAADVAVWICEIHGERRVEIGDLMATEMSPEREHTKECRHAVMLKISGVPPDVGWHDVDEFYTLRDQNARMNWNRDSEANLIDCIIEQQVPSGVTQTHPFITLCQNGRWAAFQTREEAEAWRKFETEFNSETGQYELKVT